MRWLSSGHSKQVWQSHFAAVCLVCWNDGISLPLLWGPGLWNNTCNILQSWHSPGKRVKTLKRTEGENTAWTEQVRSTLIMVTAEGYSKYSEHSACSSEQSSLWYLHRALPGRITIFLSYTEGMPTFSTCYSNAYLQKTLFHLTHHYILKHTRSPW